MNDENERVLSYKRAAPRARGLTPEVFPLGLLVYITMEQRGDVNFKTQCEIDIASGVETALATTKQFIADLRDPRMLSDVFPEKPASVDRLVEWYEKILPTPELAKSLELMLGEVVRVWNKTYGKQEAS